MPQSSDPELACPPISIKESHFGLPPPFPFDIRSVQASLSGVLGRPAMRAHPIPHQGRSRLRFLLLVVAAALMTGVAQLPALADADLPGGTFTDDDGNVHEGYIEAIAAAGITRGCNPPSNYLYCPGKPVTRGQMAAFLVRALDLPPAGNAFRDDDDSIFQADINALAASGITRGCDPPANTRFCADDLVTRGQMAAFLVRAFGYKGGADAFDDDQQSIFKDDIDALAAAGITKGCDSPANASYCPDEPIGRDQMASFLGRALKLTPMTPPEAGKRMVISTDTMIEHETLVLRPGDAIEFRNGARLMIGDGASVDWQGTPTDTWSNDGLTQNLERDVQIFGHGDIMFMKGSGRSTVQFVEVDLQPITKLGHYPLHWHLVGNGSRGTLVEGVVVKNSTNRAFVPHGSHGITFRDTIANNIIREAYWWDGPSAEATNATNDVLYDHALAYDVRPAPNERGLRFAAFRLGQGKGNTVRESVTRGIEGSRNCSGFAWPELNQKAGTVWTFQDNKSFDSACDSIFVWQNGGDTHLVEGFFGTETIEHGAYSNDFRYVDIDVPGVLVHAVGWSITGGSIGDVVDAKHRFEGTVSFTDVSIDSLTIDNDGENPAHYVINGSNLTCADITWLIWPVGTSATIDGVACAPP